MFTCKMSLKVPLLSGRWAGATARLWLLSSAACSSRCPPVWTLSPSSTSSTRRWGGRGAGGAAATTRRPSTSTRTRLCWTPPPSPLPATRSCQPRPPPSWWRWRRPGLRANGGPPRSRCSKASRSSESPLVGNRSYYHDPWLWFKLQSLGWGAWETAQDETYTFHNAFLDVLVYFFVFF